MHTFSTQTYSAADAATGAIPVPLIKKLADEPALARHERIINSFARVTQFLTWPVLYLLFTIFFSIHVQGRENFKSVKGPFIIISNHISFYDSFFFRLALGLWTLHLPLRFMAVSKFDWPFLNFLAKIGVVDFVYSLFGAFTVVVGRGLERNLEEAREIIRVGGNVVIYPEGGIVPGHDIAPFRHGASVLAALTNAPVIPVSMRFCEGGWLRGKLAITVGEPIQVSHNMPTGQITNLLQKAVMQMYDASEV